MNCITISEQSVICFAFRYLPFRFAETEF